MSARVGAGQASESSDSRNKSFDVTFLYPSNRIEHYERIHFLEPRIRFVRAGYHDKELQNTNTCNYLIKYIADIFA